MKLLFKYVNFLFNLKTVALLGDFKITNQNVFSKIIFLVYYDKIINFTNT